ncbi:hypothetical protein H5410_048036 [Solanum commersonii]|uniref:CCHC-type domain-containing protein n=1 Tax=Solanum commersonii TaxID=4109 RepID=A0A9J5XIT1_SOLCO|nr:hypothetical protein H5410_048036 [Solanum commersonii]
MKAKYNLNVTCTYCGKTGHVELNCFRLIGFPDDFQFTHEKGFNNQVKENGDQIRGNRVMTMEETYNKQNFGIDITNQNYSQEQYNQFVKMFKHIRMEEGTNSEMEINVNAVAGTIIKYLGSCFSVTNSSRFRSLSSLTLPLTINLHNYQTILVTHIGTVSLFSNLILENVLYVPSFKYNLMSVHKFCSEFSCTLLFTLNHCVLQGLSMRRPQVFGEVSEGLYLLKPKVKEFVFNFSKNKVVLPSTVFNIPNIPSPESFPSDFPDSSSSPPNCPSPQTSDVTDSNLPTGSLPLRRSERSTKETLPVHLQDYFCSNIFLIPMTESCFAAPITSTGWSKAMQEEIAALRSNHTWDVSYIWTCILYREIQRENFPIMAFQFST